MKAEPRSFSLRMSARSPEDAQAILDAAVRRMATMDYGQEKLVRSPLDDGGLGFVCVYSEAVANEVAAFRKRNRRS